jgi:RNA polymerase sigma-70 factor, ECF subfamily
MLSNYMEDTNEQAGQGEDELIRGAAGGNRASFNILVERCAEQIFGLAFRLTGNYADAEDLAQDAFVNAFKNIGRFEHRSTFSSWVYRITLNLWKNKVKYEKRRFFFRHFSIDKPIETEEDERQVEIASNDPTPLDALQKEDEARRVQAVLEALDPEERALVVMCDIDGKTYEEMAQVLSCPLGTVKSRIARARESLRKEWLKYNELPGN